MKHCGWSPAQLLACVMWAPQSSPLGRSTGSCSAQWGCALRGANFALRRVRCAPSWPQTDDPDGNVVVPSVGTPSRPTPLVWEGTLPPAAPGLRSALLSHSHRAAEGQGAGGFHHPGQPLLPGSLRPRHESSLPASHGHAAEQERYCAPSCFPRQDACYCLAPDKRAAGSAEPDVPLSMR